MCAPLRQDKGEHSSRSPWRAASIDQDMVGGDGDPSNKN